MLHVEWIDSGREPQCAPNPNYPNGIDVDASFGQSAKCRVELPYPARRIGHFLVTCDTCRQTVAITTAGRPDDPKSVTLACRAAS